MKGDLLSSSFLFDNMAFKNLALGPSETLVIARAYEEACQELRDPGAPDGAWREKSRRMLAKRIVDLAAMGERNPNVLKTYALAGLPSGGRAKAE